MSKFKNRFKIYIIIATMILFGLPAFVLKAQKTKEAERLEQEKIVETEPGKINMDFKEADIKDVLRIISYKSGMNIVSGEDVHGKVNIHLTDVSWEKALDVILKAYGFAYEKEGNIIRICDLSKLEEEGLQTKVFSLSYAKAKETSEALQKMLSERGKIEFDARTNLLIITDVSTNLNEVGKVIAELDKTTLQVMIEAQIIEVGLGDEEKMGVNWTTQLTSYGAKRPIVWPFSNSSGNKYTPDGFPGTVDTSVDFKYGTLDFNQFQTILQFLSTRTDTNILSNPKITTLNNQEAKITVGKKWPTPKYAYNEEQGKFHISDWEYVEYGILLTVTPNINQDGYVTLNIHPEISDEAGTITFDTAEIPILTTQEVETNVMIKDGETLIIGGLLKDKKVKTKKKVPILGDIPFLKFLFSHDSETIEKKDLLIFITPHIITDAKVANVHYLSKSGIGREDSLQSTEDSLQSTVNSQQSTVYSLQSTENGDPKPVTRNPKPEDGEEKTVTSHQSPVSREPKTETRKPKPEDGEEKTEDGEQKTEIKIRKLEIGNQKIENGKQKTEDGKEKAENRERKNLKSEGRID
ncbi:MAG: secretin and TonB N-terminal domain-containing protein [Candidatus Omnitrophica bacterium]|nr:secretin and TonB N-terminal domain-containing protein [Candidatus Omnitrophota bacterium]